MGDRLSQIVDALKLGTATLAKIRQNLAWALLYNVVGIPLAAGKWRRGALIHVWKLREHEEEASCQPLILSVNR